MILKVDFSEIEQSFDVLFAEADKSFDVGFENLLIVPEKPDFDYYTGEYEVIPKISSQVLETKQKIMESDLVVEKIPYYDTSNASGGTTVFIGNYVEIAVTDDGLGNVSVSGATHKYDAGNLTVLKANGEAITGVIIQ